MSQRRSEAAFDIQRATATLFSEPKSPKFC